MPKIITHPITEDERNQNVKNTKINLDSAKKSIPSEKIDVRCV